MVPSSPADTRRSPLGLKLTASTTPPRPPTVAISFPLANSHLFTVPSALAEAIHWQLGCQAIPCTLLACPRNHRTIWPVVPSRSRIVRSALPETSQRPSGLQATALANAEPAE